MACNKENVASAKSIMKNGGILENEVISEDGKIDQRYWIELEEKASEKDFYEIKACNKRATYQCNETKNL